MAKFPKNFMRMQPALKDEEQSIGFNSLSSGGMEGKANGEICCKI